ncbi:MAG: diphosphate--fructose-6-phosphate 1-phosphotransferase [Provencibacterium sp.]|nr:diphosphate--fructose-6-phosphate 1-phosphotransferase [Provencibacterium sp.]
MEQTNLLIIHGGAPTAVINASLFGAIMQAKRQPEIRHIYGALGGSLAAARGEFIDLGAVEEEKLRLLPSSPSSAIGTSRDHLEPQDYEAIAKTVAERGVGIVCFNGGNGSMDACGKVYAACQKLGVQVRVVGIPKTMDNDIAVTDHAPGYGSAARYMAASVAEVCCDVRGLPIHIAVVEAMGRSAGWVAAASALAEESGAGGPDLIYLPERPFEEERFLSDVQGLIARKGCGVVVASEGLHYQDGTPIVEPIMTVGRATYFGDVGAHLANLIIRRLGYKARSEKPGILGRASIAWQSAADREEAVLAGQEAVRAAAAGQTGVMVGFERISDEPYAVKTVLIPIEQVMLTEKTLPDAFINAEGNGVTEAFKRWCRPLVGPLPPFVSFRKD